MHKLIPLAAAAVILFAGCGGSASSVPDDAVARVDRTYLTAREVRASVPAGLSQDDSLTYARAYISNWVEQNLILKHAAGDIDLEEIDRLVDEYRAELIMTEYRRRMAESARGDFSDDSLRQYYDTHTADFRLHRPLVRGLYIKIDSAYADLRQLRSIMRSDRPEDQDRLDNIASAEALHYDNFKERWVDWEQIETRIPGDAPAPVAGTLIERTSAGYTYLLRLTEIMPAGSPMPYQAAEPLVRERLLNNRRRAYDAILRRDLFDRALTEGTAEIYR